MGKIKKIACASCKEEWQCMTGCGLAHALLKNAAQEFPKEVRERIMRENREEFPVFEFGCRISVCGGCNNIVSVPVLAFPEREEAYAGHCPICGDEVSLIDDMETAACPVCGERTLAEEEIGMWD